MQIKFKYNFPHQVVDFRDASFSSTEIFCPNCGKQDVWVEDGEGDYYEGPGHFCMGCNTGFSMPRIYPMGDEPKYKKLIEELNRARNPDVI